MCFFFLSNQGDSSDLIAPADLNNHLDEDDSTQADISLDDSVSAPLPGSTIQSDETDLSDTTEDDREENGIQ